VSESLRSGRAPEAGGTARTTVPVGRAVLRVALALVVAYAALGAGLTYWQVARAEELTDDPANPLVLAAARNAPRGRILDASGRVLARNEKGPDGTLLRRYTYGAFAPVIGYKSLRFGTAGLERAYDAELTGLGQITPADRLLRKFRADPYDPLDVVLSIDLRTQARAMDLLGGSPGAIVAIEPHTGRILALASTPTFNPNRLVDPERGDAYFNELRDVPEDESALLNRATQGRFVPGSTFKIVTAIAALGSGAITPETTYRDQPREERTGFRVEGYAIRDGHHTATGNRALAVVEATEVSCNIFFAHAALTTGGENLSEWAARLGFGNAIPFDLPTAASRVTNGGGKDGGFKSKVELATAGFGQGETFVSPLQMALVAQTVANDGRLMRPRLVDELRSPETGQARKIGPQEWNRVINPADDAIIKQAMQQAVEGDLGRGFAGAAKVPGVPTAGKSGTAELGGNGEPHSWFIGFAPVDEPRIAIAVLVERGGFGRERAVPMAGQLMATYLRLTAP
jgi:peptidoglycan glycosyltransferase